MTRKSTITIAPENVLEDESRQQVTRALAPWRFTWIDGHNDFGRDSLVQVVNVESARGLTLAPITFLMQLKAHAGPFRDRHSERLYIRHVLNWSHSASAPVVVIVWSQCDKSFRIRTAREIVVELDVARPRWRDQDRVSVHFHNEHSFTDSISLREHIVEIVLADQERFGKFLSERAIQQSVTIAGREQARGSARRSLLLMTTSDQQSWLVSTDAYLCLVVDGPGTQSGKPLIRWWLKRSRDSAVTTEPLSRLQSLLNIGKHNGILFSPKLFPSDATLVALVRDMLY